MTTFSDFAAFSAYLDELGQFRMQPGLERMEAVLDRVGSASPVFAAVRVVGTNGKGSTAAILERTAREAGLRTGLYTSPHFLSVRERIRVQGRELPEGNWVETADRLFADFPAAARELTYFELLTVLALLLFKQESVDFAVLEHGLGGRFDAVSAIQTHPVIFTRIGLDHTRYLGSTVEEIAAEKAHALHAGEQGVIGPQLHGIEPILLRTAERIGASLSIVREFCDYEPATKRVRLLQPPETVNVNPAMPGTHQMENALTALAGWKAACTVWDFPYSLQHWMRAVENVQVPGRLQIIPKSSSSPRIILDAAHNPDGLRALAHVLRELDLRPDAVVFTCLQDKPLSLLVPYILDIGDGPVYVPEIRHIPRALPAAEVARAVGRRAVVVQDTAQALEFAAEAAGILVCGSLFLLAEFFTLRPELLKT